MYEEIRRGAVSDVLAALENIDTPKGEIVLVVHGAPPAQNHENVNDLLAEALQTMTTKEAAISIAHITGQPRKELYELALKIARDQA
jgi:16S rRNA (cytidine1402-2'-O)-methyltransferase